MRVPDYTANDPVNLTDPAGLYAYRCCPKWYKCGNELQQAMNCIDSATTGASPGVQQCYQDWTPVRAICVGGLPVLWAAKMKM